jgi:microsomal dipeptidase-like Zn-dependent dipeptidase
MKTNAKDIKTLFREAKELHKSIYTIDSHCDTPMYFHYGIDIGKKNATLSLFPKDLGANVEDGPVLYDVKVDIPQMQAGGLDAVFMVAYLKQGPRDEETSQRTVEKTEGIIREILRQVDQNKSLAGIARSTADLQRLKAEGRKAIFIGIENGYGIGKDIRNIRKFYDLGARYITLSHNGDNDICDAAMESFSEHGGLSRFGREVVREMNRLGMMIDVSHTSEQTSFEVVELSEYPIIASHSSTKALCNHPRNVSNALMRRIAEKGGVIQVCIYPVFLREDGLATVVDLVDHIEHVIHTVGIDHVGIGSDFDGGGGIPGVNSAEELWVITAELLHRDYSKADIAQIWGGNLMRVMDVVQNQSSL